MYRLRALLRSLPSASQRRRMQTRLRPHRTATSRSPSLSVQACRPLRTKRSSALKTLSHSLMTSSPASSRQPASAMTGKGRLECTAKLKPKMLGNPSAASTACSKRCSRSKRRSQSSSAAMPPVTQRFFRSAKTIIAQAFLPTLSCPHAFRLSLLHERRNTQKK